MKTGEPASGEKVNKSWWSILRERTTYTPAEGLVVKNHRLAAFIRVVFYFYVAAVVAFSIECILFYLEDSELPVALLRIAFMLFLFIAASLLARAVRTRYIEKYAMGLPDSNISSKIQSEKMSSPV